ncbi:MAG: site-specific integrase [Oscillospiraceae bacterium]|nr:site-specific integrase [Oscillospiraceae bacterium]
MPEVKIPKARQRASGKWSCRVRVGDKDISITRNTKNEAIAEAIALKAGIKEAVLNPQRKSLTKAIDDYIEDRASILSPATIRGYRIIQNNRFKGLMRKDIGSITPDQWQRAVNLEARSVSAKTLTNSWRFISSVINEVMGQRPTVRLPQIVPNERQWLTPEQIPVFVDSVKGRTIEIPALLALSSLRCSELLNLRWKDIDLEKATLRVNGAAVYDEKGVLIHKKENKNKTSRRTVPIIPPLLEALRAQKWRGEYVVTMTPNGIYKHINRVCEAQGLPKVGIHGLRHSFASLAVHLKMPEKVAMQIGGWADDQTMRKIYTHISQKDISQHASAFTDFFAPAKEKSVPNMESA